MSYSRRIHVGGDVFPESTVPGEELFALVDESGAICMLMLKFYVDASHTLGIVASDVDPGLLVGGIDGRRSFLDLVGGCRRNRSRLGYERGHIGND